MSLLDFATRHVRDQLPGLSPELARRVNPGSFVVEQRYLGRRVIFLDRVGDPAVVYKASTAPELNHFLETGLAALDHAAQRGLPVSAPLARLQFGRRIVLVSDWLPGQTLARELAADSRGGHGLADAVAAVTQLHQGTLGSAGGRIPDLEARAAWWLEVLFGARTTPRSVRATTEDCLRALLKLTSSGPVVTMHGDFVTVNLIRTHAGELTAIDWDLALAVGPPAVDLISLLLDANTTRTGQTRSQSLRACFLDHTREAEGCWRTLDNYASALRLDPATLPLFIGATHVKMVAEDRHYALLHLGQITGERASQEMLVIEEFFDRFSEALAVSCAGSGASS